MTSSPRLAFPREFGAGAIVDGRYRVVGEIGRGGMGAVYEAEQIKLRKRVAIKVLQSNAKESEDGDSNLKRFLREARVASAIRHRNVVDIIDFGELADGATYYVMEFLQGRDLSSVLKHDGPMPWPRARKLLRQVLSALAAVHEQGIIHRDIKPANIVLLDEPDEWGNEWVKVLDFGVAKVQETDAESQALTGTSQLLGTAAYMAPEIARGELTDHRSDLYALGIVGYELLTGTVPFKAANTFQVLLRQINEWPQRPSEINPEVSEAMEAFLLGSLAKNPDDRYRDATEMTAALEAVDDTGVAKAALPAAASGSRERGFAAPPEEEEAAPVSRRWPIVALLAAFVVVAVGTTWLLLGGQEAEPPTTDTPAVGAAPQPAPASVAAVAGTSDGADTESGADSDAGAQEHADTSGTTSGPTGTDTGSDEPEGSSSDGAQASTPPAHSGGGCRTFACRQKGAERRLRRAVRARCRSLNSGDKVQVRLTIGTAGEPLMSSALAPHEGSPLGKCVVGVASKARFPPQAKLVVKNYTFKP